MYYFVNDVGSDQYQEQVEINNDIYVSSKKLEEQGIDIVRQWTIKEDVNVLVKALSLTQCPRSIKLVAEIDDRITPFLPANYGHDNPGECYNEHSDCLESTAFLK